MGRGARKTDREGQRPWIGATEAGRMLGVHPQTVVAWAAAGHLVAYRAHPRARHQISRASVEAMLADRQRALGPSAPSTTAPTKKH